jgi:hypothetical protein
MITMIAATEVDRHEFASADASVSGRCMREGSARAAGDDGFKAITVGAVELVKIGNAGRHLRLADARDEDRQELVEYAFADGDRTFDQFDLAVIFDGDERFEGAGGGSPTDLRESGLPPAKTGDRCEVGVESDPGPRRDPNGRRKHVGEWSGADDDLGIVHFRPHLFRIPAVGRKDRFRPVDEEESVRTGEAAQIADVRQVRHDEAVETARIKQLADGVDP